MCVGVWGWGGGGGHNYYTEPKFSFQTHSTFHICAYDQTFIDKLVGDGKCLLSFFYLEPIFKARGAQNAEELLVCILMVNSDQTSMESCSW